MLHPAEILVVSFVREFVWEHAQEVVLGVQEIVRVLVVEHAIKHAIHIVKEPA